MCASPLELSILYTLTKIVSGTNLMGYVQYTFFLACEIGILDNSVSNIA